MRRPGRRPGGEAQPGRGGQSTLDFWLRYQTVEDVLWTLLEMVMARGCDPSYYGFGLVYPHRVCVFGARDAGHALGLGEAEAQRLLERLRRQGYLSTWPGTGRAGRPRLYFIKIPVMITLAEHYLAARQAEHQ